MKNFLRRHQEIAVTSPEGLRSQRARGFTPESVAQYFFKSKNPHCAPFNTILQDVTSYNFEETGINIVQNKLTKILGLRGKRQISSVQSAERGSLVTVVYSASPNGHFIPQLLVFPRKYIKPELMHGTPPGSIHACHPSGWTQSEIFHPVVSSFHQAHKVDQKKTLLSSYRTGTIHTQGTWRSLR